VYPGLAQNAAASATSNLFADILKAPAVQSPGTATGAWRSVDLRRSQPGGAAVFCGSAPKHFPATPHRHRHRQPQDAGKFSAGFGDVVGLSPQSTVHSPKPAKSRSLSSLPWRSEAKRRRLHPRRCSIPLGTCCRTKANSRMPTPSATGWKRSSSCPDSQGSTRGAQSGGRRLNPQVPDRHECHGIAAKDLRAG
jgi:hypothetical protein